MKRLIPLVFVVALSACSTSQVQQTCAETQHILALVQPYLAFAPPEIQIAATLIGAGTVACESAQYAAMREQVIAWLRAKGARI